MEESDKTSNDALWRRRRRSTQDVKLFDNRWVLAFSRNRGEQNDKYPLEAGYLIVGRANEREKEVSFWMFDHFLGLECLEWAIWDSIRHQTQRMREWDKKFQMWLSTTCFIRGAAIAHWIRLCLPSCRPGFKSQAHHVHFYLCYICHVKRTKINKKKTRFGPFF